MSHHLILIIANIFQIFFFFFLRCVVFCGFSCLQTVESVISARSRHWTAVPMARAGENRTLTPLISCPTSKSKGKFTSGLRNQKDTEDILLLNIPVSLTWFILLLVFCFKLHSNLNVSSPSLWSQQRVCITFTTRMSTSIKQLHMKYLLLFLINSKVFLTVFLKRL